MSRKLFLPLILAGLGLASCVTRATADVTANATLWQWSDVTYFINDVPTFAEAGSFHVTVTPPGTTYTGYCLNPGLEAIEGTDFSATVLPDTGGFGWLYNQYAATVSGDPTTAAALQLAIWESATDGSWGAGVTGADVLTAGNGNFSVNDAPAAVLADAAAYLDAWQASGFASADVSRLHPTDAPSSQDLIYGPLAPPVVPESGSLLLLGFGLLAPGALLLRRKSSREE